MAINRQKLLAEVQNIAGVPNETWVEESYSGGVTHQLVEFWLDREIDFLAGYYEFSFLQQELNYTSGGTANDFTLNSAGTAIEWKENWLTVDGGKVADVPIAFQHLSDIRLNKWEDNGNRVLSYDSYDKTKGVQLIQFLADKSSSAIELYVLEYPEDVRQFPRDFYDLFLMKLAIRALRIQQSSNTQGLLLDFKEEAPKKELMLKGKYARETPIGLVKKTPNNHRYMTRTDLVSNYRRRTF